MCSRLDHTVNARVCCRLCFLVHRVAFGASQQHKQLRSEFVLNDSDPSDYEVHTGVFGL
jgi:hypothetical protein